MINHSRMTAPNTPNESLESLESFVDTVMLPTKTNQPGTTPIP